MKNRKEYRRKILHIINATDTNKPMSKIKLAAFMGIQYLTLKKLLDENEYDEIYPLTFEKAKKYIAKYERKHGVIK